MKKLFCGLTILFMSGAVMAQAPERLSDEDKREIQALSTGYLDALFACKAEEFADLFVPQTGWFASGFRGQMMGREQLIALVESERHCSAAAEADGNQRSGGVNAPMLAIQVGATGVTGVAELAGGAQYQDRYLKTARGWRFASRSVLIAAEIAMGLDAGQLQQIQEISGPGLGDNYVPDVKGIERLLNSGVSISVADGKVRGQAYLEQGGYDEIVYGKNASGGWNIVSRTHKISEE